jgi:ferric-dicitrate binding protein FerR (iron transport regulator)
MKDISLIIARILLKNANKDDADVFSKWKNISGENASFAHRLEVFWNHPAEEKLFPRLDTARKRLIARLNSKSEDASKKSLNFYLQRIAAAIIFIISIAGASIYFTSETDLFYQNNWVEISTEASQQSKVSLPDGSLVWLNAGTVVKYHSNKKERQVRLNGEAYFEVNHSPDYPFVVEVGDAKIKVLGTKFNVSHYPDSKVTEASLLSGKIAMSLEKSGKVVNIVPGEKVTYDEETQVLSKTVAKVQNDIVWRQGILVFENESFYELTLKLTRYYGVNFVYNRDAFENIHYTGTIDNLSISNVLEFINLTIPINYKIENKTIRLSLKK